MHRSLLSRLYQQEIVVSALLLPLLTSHYDRSGWNTQEKNPADNHQWAVVMVRIYKSFQGLRCQAEGSGCRPQVGGHPHGPKV